MKVLFTLSLLTTLLVSACDSSDPESQAELKITATQQEIISADQVFGIQLFKALHNAQSDENLFISPLSISYALGMTLNGAGGDTQAEMIDMLGKAGLSLPELNESYRDLMDALESLDPKVVMEIANSIWYREDFQVLESFKATNENYFDAEVAALNFGDPGAKNTINQWVDDKTHGKIEEIIDEIMPDHVMFLINAIYFNGRWTTPFDPELTTLSRFFNLDDSFSEVAMMHHFGEVKYSEFETYEAVELPYGDGHFSMVVMLPSVESSADELVAQLSPSQLEATYEGLESEEIFMWMPRFELEYKKKLKNILIDLGMEKAFISGANFEGINPDASLVVNEVVHKTFVEVNEEGTEAAAVTVVEIVETSLPPNPMFRVDRPFVFLIKDNVANTLIFAGKVNNL